MSTGEDWYIIMFDLTRVEEDDEFYLKCNKEFHSQTCGNSNI